MNLFTLPINMGSRFVRQFGIEQNRYAMADQGYCAAIFLSLNKKPWKASPIVVLLDHHKITIKQDRPVTKDKERIIRTASLPL